MNEWTKQAGYPVVNVKKIGNSLVLTQVTKQKKNKNTISAVSPFFYFVLPTTTDDTRSVGYLCYLFQEQFSLGRSNESDTKWFVRSSYTTSDNRDFGTETTPSVWLDPKTNETTVPVTGDVKWYIFNVQSTGKLWETIRRFRFVVRKRAGMFFWPQVFTG